MRVRWLRTALRNLREEAEHIARDDPAAAERIAARIRSAVQRLEAHPSMGRAGRVPGTREFVVPRTSYLVPYRIRNETIQILRVFHAARKWPERF